MRALARPMTRPVPPRVVVVGGGVTGLTAAYAIHRARPDADLTLLESASALGGNIRTERQGGFVIDAGPDSFVRTKPDAVELCRILGLDPELISTESAARHVYVAHRGKLTLMPGGMALAVPTRLGPLLETPLLSPRGKLRMLAEPFVPKARTAEDESIESFFTRRVGAEGARCLAGPLLGGIYAGDVSKLSMHATFPQLVELEQRHGSLLRGLLAGEIARSGGGQVRPGIGQIVTWLRRTGGAEAASPFLSLRGGMGTLIDALARTLPGGAVRTGTAVTAIERLEGGYRVVTAEGAHLADAVVLATPAHVAARVVPDAELARELGAIPYVSTATVFFALDRTHLAHNLQGFGFIVPPGEARILAGTWVSSKWAGRAPEGAALIRAFVGGARDPDRVAASTDDELVLLARTELEKLMGPLGAPLFTRVHRYAQSNPQPLVGHRARLDRIQARLAALPGLEIAGAAYDGVGIPDCVRQANAAASRVVQTISQHASAAAGAATA
jgi:oxygen-dependent protoporphyrinogen oxidase